MKLSLDEYNKVEKMLAGLYQYSENDLFVQSELALSEDEFLFYDDSGPDDIKGDTFHYTVKKRVAIKDVAVVLKEKIIKNKALKKYGRLDFLAKTGESLFEYYYFLSDKKIIKDFLKTLKKRGLKIKNREIDLSQEAL